MNRLGSISDSRLAAPSECDLPVKTSLDKVWPRSNCHCPRGPFDLMFTTTSNRVVSLEFDFKRVHATTNGAPATWPAIPACDADNQVAGLPIFVNAKVRQLQADRVVRSA